MVSDNQIQVWQDGSDKEGYLMKNLKPCPFCGAPANKWSWNGGTRIDCSAWDSSDKHTHYVGIGAKTEQEAIEAWNNRAGEQDG